MTSQVPGCWQSTGHDAIHLVSWLRVQCGTEVSLPWPCDGTYHGAIRDESAVSPRSTHERTDTAADRAAAPAQEAGRARRPGRRRGGAWLEAGRQRECATLYRSADVDRSRPHGGGAERTRGHCA